MWRLMLEFPFFNTIFQDSSRILSGLFRDYSGILDGIMTAAAARV